MIFFETLHEHALSIDFAMLVVIWMVQVIIYPAFRNIDAVNFPEWHAQYCKQIAWFVLPLMVSQILECTTSCFFVGDTCSWVRLVCVLLAWAVTFFHSAPQHRKLTIHGKKTEFIDLLLTGNWFRTFLWTIVFLASYLNY